MSEPTLVTEAAKTEAQITEVKQEVVEAKQEGDPAAAAEAKGRMDTLTAELADIKKALKALTERPFAPAPQPVKPPETPAVAAATEPEKPKERVHRFGSSTWFGDRAYED